MSYTHLVAIGRISVANGLVHSSTRLGAGLSSMYTHQPCRQLRCVLVVESQHRPVQGWDKLAGWGWGCPAETVTKQQQSHCDANLLANSRCPFIATHGMHSKCMLNTSCHVNGTGWNRCGLQISVDHIYRQWKLWMSWELSAIYLSIFLCCPSFLPFCGYVCPVQEVGSAYLYLCYWLL